MEKQYFQKRGMFLMVILLVCNHYFSEAQISQSKDIFSGHRAEIEHLVVADDWSGLWAIFHSLQGKTPDSLLCRSLEPEVRLLLGHAALATNHNNTAAWSFYCDCDSTASQSLVRWQTFTEGVLKAYPKNPSTLYLYADALARNEKMEEAKTQLDEALRVSENHILTRNARGVIQWILFEKTNQDIYQEGCMVDFNWFKTEKPLFTDNWINLGVQAFRNGYFITSTEYFKQGLIYDKELLLGKVGIAVSLVNQANERTFFSVMDDLYKEYPAFPLVSFNSGNSWFPKSIRGFSASGSYSTPFGIKVSGSVSFSKDRGGVFLCVDENNSPIFTNGSPRFAGVTFTLNYPFPKINIEPTKK